MEVLKTIMRVRSRGDIAINFITQSEIHSKRVANRFLFLELGQVTGKAIKTELEGEDIRKLMADGAGIRDLER